MEKKDGKEKNESCKVPTSPCDRQIFKPSTPDSTKRELKKLEDYWTRQNPVVDDSPRLRSKRKVNFGNDKKTDLKIRPIHVNSPIADTREVGEPSDTKHVNNDNSTVNGSPIQFLPIPSEVEDQSDSTDTDDDDYIPPRKKLRSEVTKEELWDGIPLAISFKRLAPISRNSNTNEVVVKGDLIGSQESNADNEIEYKVLEDSVGSGSNINDEIIDRSRLVFKRVISVDDTGDADEHLNGEHLPHCSTDTDSQVLDENCNLVKPINTSTSLANVTFASSAHDCDKTLSQILVPDSEDFKDSITDQKNTEDRPDILDDISANVGQQNINNPDANNPTDNEKSGVESIQRKANDTKVIETINTPVRRSRRLSDNEKRRSQHNTPNTKIADTSKTIPEENEPQISDNNAENKITDMAYLSKPQIKFGSIKLNKPQQKIPPLRIRLKTSTNGKKKKATTVKDIENEDNDNEEAGTSKTDNSEEKKKTKPAKKAIAKQQSKQSLDKVDGDKIKTNKKVSKNKGVCNGKSKKGSEHDIQDGENRNEFTEVINKKSNDKNSKKDKATKKPCPKSRKTVEKKKENESKETSRGETATTRSPSPSSTSSKMELRLNNVRRISAASELLTNTLLNKHACVLWSSENRRHAQLTNPNATLAELDGILIKKWNKLSDREKVKYFQRARDALKEENRHSTRRNEEKTANEVKPVSQKEQGIESFLQLTAASQMTEIKKWLNLYHGISPQHCALVIGSFKASLNEDNMERDTKQQEKGKQKTKLKKNKRSKRTDGQTEEIDSCSKYRKLLYTKIMESKETFVDLLTEQKRIYSQQVLDNFDGLIKRLVVGESVHFAGDIRSDKLTEILYDLRTLERENKISVLGDINKDQEYNEILRCLRFEDDVKHSTVNNLNDDDVDYQIVDQLCNKIETIPNLSVDMVERYMSEEVTSGREEMNLLTSGTTEPMDSPVTLLTDWVADDILTRQPKIRFRRAVSLLSNRVVPSPTFVNPKSSNDVNHSVNKVQNRNVLFTQLN